LGIEGVNIPLDPHCAFFLSEYAVDPVLFALKAGEEPALFTSLAWSS
jgi:hypothetical protein